jgi:hypothetical protein
MHCSTALGLAAELCIERNEQSIQVLSSTGLLSEITDFIVQMAAES